MLWYCFLLHSKQYCNRELAHIEILTEQSGNAYHCNDRRSVVINSQGKLHLLRLIVTKLNYLICFIRYSTLSY